MDRPDCQKSALFLYLFDVYSVCFNSNQTIFKMKTEKAKTEKIRGIQGLTNSEKYYKPVSGDLS